MFSYKTQFNCLFVMSVCLVALGVFLIVGVWLQNLGFLLVGVGLSCSGIMFSLSIGRQSTIDVTKNLISILKFEGIISSDSELRINEKLEVVKRVSVTSLYKYDIKGTPKKTAI